MLAGVVLHVVESPVPVNPTLNFLRNKQIPGGDNVNRAFTGVDYINHRDVVNPSLISWLPSRFRVKSSP